MENVLPSRYSDYRINWYGGCYDPIKVEADLTPIKKIMQSISGLWHEQWTDDTLRKALNSSNGLSFVYETEDEIEGFIFAYDFGFRAYIAEIAVVEKSHFGRTGKDLLKYVENIIRESKYSCGLPEDTVKELTLKLLKQL